MGKYFKMFLRFIIITIIIGTIILILRGVYNLAKKIWKGR